MRADKCHHVRTSRDSSSWSMATEGQHADGRLYWMDVHRNQQQVDWSLSQRETCKPEPSQIERRRHQDRTQSDLLMATHSPRCECHSYRHSIYANIVSIDTGRFARLHWWWIVPDKQTSCIARSRVALPTGIDALLANCTASWSPDLLN